jgi:hypothetical protein
LLIDFRLALISFVFAGVARSNRKMSWTVFAGALGYPILFHVEAFFGVLFGGQVGILWESQGKRASGPAWLDRIRQ